MPSTVQRMAVPNSCGALRPVRRWPGLGAVFSSSTEKGSRQIIDAPMLSLIWDAHRWLLLSISLAFHTPLRASLVSSPFQVLLNVRLRQEAFS